MNDDFGKKNLPTSGAGSGFGNIMTQVYGDILRDSLLSDDFLDFVKQNTLPLETLISYYQCAIMEVETKFNVLNQQFSLRLDRNPIQTIKTRIKSHDSILKKIRRKGYELSLDSIEKNINDVAGVRVVCAYIDDIYLLADCLLKQDDIRLVERKDYIKNPKPSGYRSLHLIVEVPIFLQNEKRYMKVEVQLRTIAMDFWASLEHTLHYKKKSLPKGGEDGTGTITLLNMMLGKSHQESQVNPELMDQLSAELVECAEQIAQIDMRMESIRDRIFQLEIDEKKGVDN